MLNFSELLPSNETRPRRYRQNDSKEQFVRDRDMDAPGGPRECRRRAARCTEQAVAATSIGLQTAFRGLSLRWDALAIQLERLQRMLNQQVTALAEPCPRRRKPSKNPSRHEL